MARLYGTFRAACGHEGCKEFALYEADTRAYYVDLSKRYGDGQWRCVRHSQPGEVLSFENNKTVQELSVIKSGRDLYWGKEKAFSGFSHGPGFKAFAEDFPEGTILRITAEIISSPLEQSALERSEG